MFFFFKNVCISELLDHIIVHFRRNDPPLRVITQESMTLEEIGKEDGLIFIRLSGL